MKAYLIKFKKLVPLILSFLILFSSIPAWGEALSDDYFQYIYNIVEKNYVNSLEVNEDIRDIDQLFEKLDEHSEYYDVEEFQRLIDNIEGSFVGIGVYINDDEGRIRVVDTVKGSPAERAGLRSGDIILTVDGSIVRDIGTKKAAELIRGEENTLVNLRVKRGNLILIRNIERAKIQESPVSYEIIDDIGYIRLRTFSNDSYKKIMETLTYMDINGIKKIILDLRDNPGGYLNRSIEIGGLFIEKGPIVHVKYKDRGLETFSSYLEEAPYELVVLINERSASASEILAAAVQDRKAGILVGAKSFGKGTVQELIPLPDGDGMKITIAEYFSPLMKKIDGIGVRPDIEVENLENKDLQLERAIELLKM